MNNLARFLPSNKYISLIIVLITIMCYSNVLLNGYCFDDEIITENKFVVNGFQGIKDIWTHPYLVYEGINIDYRPISLTLYNIEFMLFGKNPFVGHLVNLLLYVVTLLLLLRISSVIFKLERIHYLIPLMGILLYSVHPSHTEVVASIKNRDEILSFLFMLIATLFYQRVYTEKRTVKKLIFLLLTFLFFYLSMLTKLVCLPFMVCIFLWSVFTGDYKQYKYFGALAAGCVLLIIIHYIFFHDYLNRFTSFYENPLVPGTALNLRLGLAFNSLLFYLKFLLIPFPSRFYYGYDVIPFESFINPLSLLSFCIYGALIILAIISTMKKKPYAYFLCAFLFFVFLYSNLFIPYPGIVSERAMFQLSYFFIFFIILFVKDFIPVSKKNKKANSKRTYLIPLITYAFLFLSFFILTLKRNFEWKDHFTLLLHDMPYLQKSTYANQITAYNCNYKSTQLQSTDTVAARKWAELAVYYYNASLSLSPIAKAYFYLGNTYRYNLNNLEMAKINYLKAIELDPSTKGLARQLGSLYFMQHEFSNAIPFYKQAVKESPQDAELLFYEALNMYNAKNVSQFLSLNDQLLKKFPTTQYPYLNYATYFFNLNDVKKTVSNFDMAIRNGCRSPEVLNYMIQYYSGNKNFERAAYYQRMKTETNKQN